MLVASKDALMEVLKVGEKVANLVSELADLMSVTMGSSSADWMDEQQVALTASMMVEYLDSLMVAKLAARWVDLRVDDSGDLMVESRVFGSVALRVFAKVSLKVVKLVVNSAGPLVNTRLA